MKPSNKKNYLSHKGSEIIVLKEFRKYLFREIRHLFHNKCVSFFVPGDDILILRILTLNTKYDHIYLKNFVCL